MTASTISLANPTALGFSPARLDRLHTLASAYVDSGKLAGTITLVARRGEIVHFSACGKRDLASGAPMELDTIVRIYSMTKPITTVAAMMLFEDGHFLLDTPVRDFIPAFGDVQVCVDMRKVGPVLAPPARGRAGRRPGVVAGYRRAFLRAACVLAGRSPMPPLCARRGAGRSPVPRPA